MRHEIDCLIWSFQYCHIKREPKGSTKALMWYYRRFYEVITRIGVRIVFHFQLCFLQRLQFAAWIHAG